MNPSACLLFPFARVLALLRWASCCSSSCCWRSTSGVFHRKAHAVSIREAAGWSVVWVTLALALQRWASTSTCGGTSRSTRG